MYVPIATSKNTNRKTVILPSVRFNTAQSVLGQNRHYVLTSMLPLHGWRNWRRTLNRGISRNAQWFFRFRTECQRSWNFEIISPFFVLLSLYIFLYSSLLHRNIKPGILEGLRGVMLRFSPLPFTGLFPILFLLSKCIFFISFDYYLSLTCTQQCTVRLLMRSALTHAQHAQPYCTVYKDSMDILFL